MKKLFVSKEDMEEFEKNNPQMKDEDSVDPLEETLDSPSPKKRKEKNDDETKAATKSDFTAEKRGRKPLRLGQEKVRRISPPIL